MLPNYVADYFPQPSKFISSRALQRDAAGQFKLKIYSKMDAVPSLRFEFERLYTEQYTHVANMPGNMADIQRLAHQFGIVAFDVRVAQFVADMCSDSRKKRTAAHTDGRVVERRRRGAQTSKRQR